VSFTPSSYRKCEILRSATTVVAGAALVVSGTVSVTGPAYAATSDNDVVEVHAGDPAWAEQAYECFETGATLTPQQEDVDGPQRAPYGSGSHHTTINEYSSQTELYRTSAYDGTMLANLSRLEYSTHADALHPDGPDRQPTYLRLNVDNDGDQVRDASLFFIPANNADQQPVQNGVWQNWDVANGHLSVDGDSGPGATTTLDEYVQSHPGATLVNNNNGATDGGALALITGCGMGGDTDSQRNGDYYADRLIVGTDETGSDADTLYDFEGPGESDGGTDQQTVDPEHRSPWASQAYDYQTGRNLRSNQTFVAGPDPAPEGAGSLRFTVSDDTNPNRIEQFRSESLDGRLLRDLRHLSFSTYSQGVAGNPAPQQPVYLYLRVDNDSDGTSDGVLFFYPANNADQQPVANNTWQHWDAAMGNWNLNGDDGPANSFTLDQYLAEHPDATIVNNADPADPSWSGGGMTFQVGAGGDNQLNGEYFLDNAEVSTSDEATSSVVSGTNYDLEPTAAPPAAPQLSISDTSVAEGDTGTADESFTVSMDEATDTAVTVDYATSDGSATAPSDYASTSGTATIPAGQTQTTITVPVNGDTTHEQDETFTTTLSAPQNAEITDGSGTGTITNDDATPAVSISDANVTEPNTGRADASFTVSMDTASDSAVTVDYATSDGTATAPSDYTSTSGTATIPAGETQTTVTVPVNGDTARELNERFTVAISNPSNAVVGDGSGRGIIANNDTDVDLAASNAVDHRVRADVSTSPQADGAPVRIYRQVSGADRVMFTGTLNDRGRVSTVLARNFARGATVRLYAQVTTSQGTYQSETTTVTVD
jgi:hypothetical protein